MKRTFFLSCLVILYFAAATAQTNQGSTSSHSVQNQNGDIMAPFAVGTTLIAELTKSIDLKHVHVGDAVTATISNNLVYGGKKIVSKGSKLVGHITVAQQGIRNKLEWRLGVIFDEVQNGHNTPMRFTGMIQAVAAPITESDNEHSDPRCHGTTAILGCRTAPASETPEIDPSSQGLFGFENLLLNSRESMIISDIGNINIGWHAKIVVRITAVPV